MAIVMHLNMFGAQQHTYVLQNIKNISNHACCPVKRVFFIKNIENTQCKISATLLLARLASKVVVFLQVQLNHVFLWYSASIVLWLKAALVKFEQYENLLKSSLDLQFIVEGIIHF